MQPSLTAFICNRDLSEEREAVVDAITKLQFAAARKPEFFERDAEKIKLLCRAGGVNGSIRVLNGR
jgi:hypothetical protein